MKKTLLFISILAIFIVACTPAEQPPVQNVPGTTPQDLSGDGLKKINSTQQLLEILQQQSSGQLGGALAKSGVAMDAVAAPVAARETAQSADEYSQTNVQVQGVDEADFIKNDGKYIYMISQDKLIIVDAYPAKDADIISKTEIEGYPSQLFLNGDKLVVFTQKDEEEMAVSPYTFVPEPRYVQRTHALLYDIEDRENPKLLEDFEFSGTYDQARMIGDHVYLITKEYVYWYDGGIPPMPLVKASGTVIAYPDIYYFDTPEQDRVFHTVASLNIETEEVNAETFLMGYSNTIYVSENNLYITYQKSYPWYARYESDRFFDVVVPLLPSGIQNKLNGLDPQEDSQEITEVLEEMYNRMTESEKKALVEEIRDAIEEYEWEQELERRKTVIHKIALDDGDIEYEAKGEVPGYLHNQFSLDEYDDNLRVATTFESYNRNGEVIYNNVYVMNEDMELVGELEHLAKDERIYSTRFMGDRLYMVTFQRIDPLFVIDLSDPEDPEVLGELKIPGFSDYLHPYDETHLIGIGKETGSNEWGGISTKGVKIALFDVSDVKNPELIDSVEIGKQGSDSEALQDHKAFLFDKERNLLVIPIREVLNSYDVDRYGYSRQRVWQGAYAFTVTLDGIKERGKVTHFEGDQDYDYYWWQYPSSIRRSLFMDDVLYTISSEKIMMNDIDSLEDINDVDLPYKREVYPTPVYKTVME